MAEVSALRIVWRNICISDVLSRGYPFSRLPLDSLPDLESLTRKAYLLGTKWLSQSPKPRTTHVFDANPSTYIEDVTFLPGKNWLLAVSKGIWSGITAWNLEAGVSRMAEWSPKGAIFNGFAVNADPDSEATLAVSIQDRLVSYSSCPSFAYCCAKILPQFSKNSDFVLAVPRQ